MCYSCFRSKVVTIERILLIVVRNGSLLIYPLIFALGNQAPTSLYHWASMTYSRSPNFIEISLSLFSLLWIKKQTSIIFFFPREGECFFGSLVLFVPLAYQISLMVVVGILDWRYDSPRMQWNVKKKIKIKCDRMALTHPGLPVEYFDRATQMTHSAPKTTPNHPLL